MEQGTTKNFDENYCLENSLHILQDPTAGCYFQTAR